MKAKEFFKKHIGDFVVLLALIATSLSLLVYYLIPRNEGDVFARIYHQNEVLYDNISLKNDDKEYPIDIVDGDKRIEMIVELKDHKIGITSSNCANQYCVHQGFTSSTVQSLICSPNEVRVVLYSKKGTSMDSGFDI